MIEDYIDERGTHAIRGVLNDWDLCKYKEQLEMHPRQLMRSVSYVY